jgi:hypothetical protein
MRAAVGIVGLALAVLVAPSLAPARARKPSPGLSKVKWRLVLRSSVLGAETVVANDRYVAFLYGSSFPYRSMLIDEQTARRQRISSTDCANPVPLALGGPSLLVTCPTNPPGMPETYQLYDLGSGSWTPFQISSQCFGDCLPVAVGRYWVKIVSDEGEPDGYPRYDYYLQNIATGQFEPDPATPGGTVFDDLNVPAGSVPLCRPLHYPSVDDREGIFLGRLSFYGQFAVTYQRSLSQSGPAWSLRRCGSKLDLRIAADPEANTPASSRAVVTTHDGATLHGWFLPSLRRFTIRPALHDSVSPVAVTRRTIYVRTGNNGQLWAATLPSPRQRSHH